MMVSGVLWCPPGEEGGAAVVTVGTIPLSRWDKRRVYFTEGRSLRRGIAER